MALQSKIITLVIFIILSGFFSGVETALFSLSRLRVKHMLNKGVRGAKTVDKLKKKPQRLLITILIGNNVVNIGASALATTVAIELSMSNAVGITTGVMTLIILIFGEITPKTLATKFNESISVFVAKPLQILQWIMFPVIIIFEFFTVAFTNMLGKNERPLVTEEELKTFVSVGREVGEIKENNLKKEECAAIGDDPDDIRMFDEVGLKLTYRGREEVKRAADYAVDSYEELIDIIKNFPV